MVCLAACIKLKSLSWPAGDNHDEEKEGTPEKTVRPHLESGQCGDFQGKNQPEHVSLKRHMHQESQRGAYWRLGVPIIHSLRNQTPPLCDPWHMILFDPYCTSCPRTILARLLLLSARSNLDRARAQPRSNLKSPRRSATMSSQL